MRLLLSCLAFLLLCSCDNTSNSAEQPENASPVEQEKHLNRLQHETSPYLLQHASNPVDWWPWSEAAFEAAKKENKPVIVSIGYSTCHWCHVMEEESFESEEVAAFMNEHFINIKVDREERPDVDQLYMEACQAITGSGGWPLNAFLLPDNRPFHAGTYFPPTSDGQRPSWLGLLKSIAQRWEEQPAELQERAEQLTQGIRANSTLLLGEVDKSKTLRPELTKQMIERLKADYDHAHGGFGGAPKFPAVQRLELLLDYAILEQDNEALEMVHQAAAAMIEGGIYDQLKGGFSRYTVDARWRIPHFEKMLYDNALLLRLISKLQMLRPSPVYEATITATIDWLKDEMKAPAGSFFSALNADSEGKEGAYYIWKYNELKNLLNNKELNLLIEHFGVSEKGNFEEENANILFQSKTLKNSDLELFKAIKNKLLLAREKRVHPSRDEKIILQWNSLIISGLIYAYRATQNEAYKQLALAAYEAIENQLFSDEKWHRTYKDSAVGETAFLGDLAALCNAQLDLYDLTQNPDFLLKTKAQIEEIEATFGGAPGGLYYLVPPEESELSITPLDLYDNALPSGNSQLLKVMRRLAAYTGVVSYRNQAREKLLGLEEKVAEYPSNFANYGRQILLLQRPERSLVISGPGAAKTAQKLLGEYRPGLAIVSVLEDRQDIASMKDRYQAVELQLYLCEDQTCQMPVGSVEALVWE